MARIEYDPTMDAREVLQDLIDAIYVYGQTQSDDPAEDERADIFDKQRAASRFLTAQKETV